ncbi:MED7 protein-domain-containing protein [Clohesyomyces aquaticus]|uniref:Mediator of RNA polymerase II transcription subunit 7 n=1 Tax=Clohesyomyces aquaticus TaxID=1231657 RepID=A0A1Y1Y6R7_9PLEO|nr:MED7 protein-domain-containing protein [Clohesyomyces aquaticus]
MAQPPPQQPDDEPINSSFFPLPPPFYKQFTTENQKRLQDFKEAEGIYGEADTSPSLSADQILKLPPELRFLVPPEPPAEDNEFRVFGETSLINKAAPTLPDWGYEQLYPSPPTPAPGEDPSIQSEWSLNRAEYLQRLIRSILLKFLELLGVMSRDPTKWRDAMTDIGTMGANMHALINEYREHQMRETLILLMEDQLDKKRAEVDGVGKMKQKVEETLANFAKNVPRKLDNGESEDDTTSSPEVKRKEIQRYMWQAMDEILGQ